MTMTLEPIHEDIGEYNLFVNLRDDSGLGQHYSIKIIVLEREEEEEVDDSLNSILEEYTVGSDWPGVLQARIK